MSNEMVKKEQTAIANYDYGDTAGAGFDDLTGNDLKIPMVYILQPLSTQLEEDESLKPGLLWNNVSKEGAPSMTGAIVGSIRFFVEKEGKGGEYVRRHEENEETVLKAIARRRNKKDALTLPNGHILEENMHLFFVHEDQTFSSLKLTPSGLDPRRSLMTDLKFAAQRQGNNPPIWAFQVKVTTEKKAFDGGSCFIPVFKAANGTWDKSSVSPDSAQFKMASHVATMVKAGQATAVESAQDSEESGEKNPLE